MHSSIFPPGKALIRADSRVPKPPKPPEKPLMPYMRYSRKVWEKVKSENPHLKLWEVGRIIGQMWRELSDEEKNVYIEQYEIDKQRYNESLRQYHSSPAYQAWMVAREKAERSIEEEERRNAARSREKHESPIDLRESYILEDNDEDPDEQFTVKHVAAARFQRNHRLMHEILSDAKLPDPGQLITETRIKILQMQVKQLKNHKKNLCSEIENCELRHQAKVRRMQDRSAAFYADYRKVMVQTPRISESQFVDMIIQAKFDVDREEESLRKRQAAESEARKHRAQQREAEIAEAKRIRQAQLLQHQMEQSAVSTTTHSNEGCPQPQQPMRAPEQHEASYNRQTYSGTLPNTQVYSSPQQYMQPLPTSAESSVEPDKNNNAVVEEPIKKDNPEAFIQTADTSCKQLQDQQHMPQSTLSGSTIARTMPSNYSIPSTQQPPSQPAPPPPPEYHYQQPHIQPPPPPPQARYPPNYYAQGMRPSYTGYPAQHAPSDYPPAQQQQMYSWQGQYQQSEYHNVSGGIMQAQRHPQAPSHGSYQRLPYSEAQAPPAPPPYQQQQPLVMHHPHQQGYWQPSPQQSMPPSQSDVSKQPSMGHYPVSSVSAAPDNQMGMLPQNQASPQQSCAPSAGYYPGYGSGPPPTYGFSPPQNGGYFHGPTPPQQQIPVNGGYGHQPYMQQQHWPQQYPPGGYPQPQPTQRPPMASQPPLQSPHPPHSVGTTMVSSGNVPSSVNPVTMQRPSPSLQNSAVGGATPPTSVNN